MFVKKLKDDEILQIMRTISDPECEIVSIFRKVTDPEVIINSQDMEEPMTSVSRRGLSPTAVW